MTARIARNILCLWCDGGAPEAAAIAAAVRG